MKMFTRAASAVFLAGTSLASLTAPAMAQAAEEDESGLKEIVVTANKREQNLQETPLSISAVSGEQLELRGISEAKDLAAIAPNVTALGGTTSGAASVITIRGISTAADESQGFDSPIGLYIDGVYLARSAASTFEVADIERVEVLRGPQGTLFGRNTTGGAINFITREPTEDASLSIKAGYGNYNQLMVRGSFETGSFADDTLRMTFTVLNKRRDGVVDNLLEPSDKRDPGSQRVSGYRWATVANLTEKLKFKNIFDYTRTSGVPHPMQLTALGSGVPFNPDPAVVAFAAANNFAISVPGNVAGYLASNRTTIVQPGCPKTASRTRVDPICLDHALPSTDKVWGNLTRLELDVEGVTVRSSTAFRKWQSIQRGGDLDGLGTINGPVLTAASTLNGMPAALLGFIPTLNPPLAPAGTAAFVANSPVPNGNISLFDATNKRDQKQFSQELEIVSDNDGPFNWVIGGFYFKESGSEQNRQIFGFVLDTNASVFIPANFGGLAGGFQAGNPQILRASAQNIGLVYRARGKSQAIYGQAEYRPGGKDGAFGITLGLRHTWDHKYVTRTQNGAQSFVEVIASPPGTTAAARAAAVALATADIPQNINDKKFSALTGHLTVDYRMTDNINLYARAAKGYRSGGFNVREDLSTTRGRGRLQPFDNESIWSYELGFKTEFGRMFRLNGAVFYNRYSDLQVTVPVAFGTGTSFGTAVANAGKVDYTGFELEGMVRASDNFWLDGNLGYTHKKFKEFIAANRAAQPVNIASVIAGAGYSPDWTTSLGANAKFAINDDANAVLRVGYTYTSDYFQFTNPLSNPFYRETKGNSRGLLDAQFRISGFKFGGGDGDLEFTLWGKNLTNKKYVARSVDFGALGFATTIYGDPRTYGATLGVKF